MPTEEPMNNNQPITPPAAERPAPRCADLDEFIFQDEHWLASDR